MLAFGFAIRSTQPWTCTLRLVGKLEVAEATKLPLKADNSFSDAGVVCKPESAAEMASNLTLTVDSNLPPFASCFQGAFRQL